MADEEGGSSERDVRSERVSDDRFRLISPELRNSIVAAGYSTQQSRLQLYDLDWMDIKEMELAVRQRKELERFLGLPNGAFIKPPERSTPASVTNSGAVSEDAPERTDAESSTPCPGRGGNVVSNFPTLRDSKWAPSGLKMGPDTTKFLIALGETFEPRLRECLEDFRVMQKTTGGESVAVLLAELLVFENIDEEGGEFIMSGRQIQAIQNCTISRVLPRQQKVRPVTFVLALIVLSADEVD